MEQKMSKADLDVMKVLGLLGEKKEEQKSNQSENSQVRKAKKMSTVKDVIEELFGEEEAEKPETEEGGGTEEEVEVKSPNPGRKRVAKPVRDEIEEEEEEEEEPEEEEEVVEEEPEEEEVEEKGEVDVVDIDQLFAKAVLRLKDEISDLKKSLVDVLELRDTMSKIGKRIDELDERLKKVEETPVGGRKAITKGAQVGTINKWNESASYQISSAYLEKAVKDGLVPIEDVVKFESTGIITPAIRQLIEKIQ